MAARALWTSEALSVVHWLCPGTRLRLVQGLQPKHNPACLCNMNFQWKQERPRAPVVKLSCLQEHVHKKKVLEIVSHHSKYNMFKARNSCI